MHFYLTLFLHYKYPWYRFRNEIKSVWIQTTLNHSNRIQSNAKSVSNWYRHPEWKLNLFRLIPSNYDEFFFIPIESAQIWKNFLFRLNPSDKEILCPMVLNYSVLQQEWFRISVYKIFIPAESTAWNELISNDSVPFFPQCEWFRTYKHEYSIPPDSAEGCQGIQNNLVPFRPQP